MKSAKYKEIFEVLQQELCDGKYGVHSPFPSEAQLVRRFQVSRFTVVKAVSRLEKDGLITRRKGKGSFPTKFARTAYGPIGLIMPGLAYGEIYAPICGEITRLCQQKGRTVLLGNTTAEVPKARAEAAKKLAVDFVQQHVAGVIMHPIEYLRDSAGVNREIVTILEQAGVPVVLLDYDIEPSPKRSKYDLAGIDNFAAGRRMGEHLVSVGVERVLFVKRKNCAPTVESRVMGLAAAIEKGMKRGTVPAKIKLAGFDDVRCASVMSPSLTTVHQPCKELARVAVELLYRRMEFPDSPVCTAMLDAPLVIRESTIGERK